MEVDQVTVRAAPVATCAGAASPMSTCGSGSGSAYIFDANMPTSQPTTSEPTSRPTTSEPTSWPTTAQPTTSQPTANLNYMEVATAAPSSAPTAAPTVS